MAMELELIFDSAHEDTIACLSFDRVRREIYSAGQGEKLIKVWDLKTGSLLRAQAGHQGSVTSLCYAASIKLLFSGSVDGNVGVWTEKGSLLQMCQVGGPVHSLAWSSRRRILALGGNRSLQVFKVDLAEALKLRQAKRAAQHDLGGHGGQIAAATNQEGSQVLRRVYKPLKGHYSGKDGAMPDFNSSMRSLPGVSKSHSITGSSERKEQGGRNVRAPLVPGVGGKEDRLSEGSSPMDGMDLCHTDIVQAIVITDAGKIVTGGYDRCLCFYDYEKLESHKPWDGFKKVKDCHKAGIISMSHDLYNNVIVTGGIDGAVKLWSLEGRCLEKFENLSNSPTCAVYVPQTNTYWATARFNRLAALDPRAPANITPYVDDPNSLSKYRLELLTVPHATDLVLGGSHQRQLVVWRYNPHAAHRVYKGHENLIEALFVLNKGDESHPDERIFSASADGKVLQWELDAEQNCDIYNVVEELALHNSNIYCMVHVPALNALVTAGEGSAIKVHYLDGEVPLINDTPLPTKFRGHEGPVSSLLVLKDGHTLISGGADCSIRVWDLCSMKALHVVHDAHLSPIQCLAYCPERDEVASCGTGNKVKIWNIKNPARMSLSMVLDHEMKKDGGEEEQHSSVQDVNPHRQTNMQWLTRSDVVHSDNQQDENHDILDAIRHATVDVPEVTQVRWVQFRACWVTAADDDIIRLWNPLGQLVFHFSYSGGSVQTMFVDNTNELLLVAMLDKTVSVYDLQDPLPLAKYVGHKELVRGIGYLYHLDCYVTCSWDHTLRLWFRPKKDHSSSLLASEKSTVREDYLMLDEECHMGEAGWDKKLGKEMPKILQEDHTWQLLEAIGILADEEEDKGSMPSASRQHRRNRRPPVQAKKEEEVEDLTGSLAQQLNEYGKQLLEELNQIAAANSKGSSGVEGGSLPAREVTPGVPFIRRKSMKTRAQEQNKGPFKDLGDDKGRLKH